MKIEVKAVPSLRPLPMGTLAPCIAPKKPKAAFLRLFEEHLMSVGQGEGCGNEDGCTAGDPGTEFFSEQFWAGFFHSFE